MNMAKLAEYRTAEMDSSRISNTLLRMRNFDFKILYTWCVENSGFWKNDPS